MAAERELTKLTFSYLQRNNSWLTRSWSSDFMWNIWILPRVFLPFLKVKGDVYLERKVPRAGEMEGWAKGGRGGAGRRKMTKGWHRDLGCPIYLYLAQLHLQLIAPYASFEGYVQKPKWGCWPSYHRLWTKMTRGRKMRGKRAHSVSKFVFVQVGQR